MSVRINGSHGPVRTMTRRQIVCLGGLAALSTAALGLAGRMAWADAATDASGVADADASQPADQGASSSAQASQASADGTSYLYAAFDNPFDGSGTCLWGFVDKTGSWAITPQFEAVGGAPGDTVPLCLGDQGNSLSQRYADAMLVVPGVFLGDLMPVQAGPDTDAEGLWGYVDKAGAWAIAPQFQAACQFSEGFALVQDSSGDFHYITPDGTDPFGALDCLTATCFCQGRAFLQGTHDGDAWGCIDTTGNWYGRSTEDALQPYVYDIPLVFSTSGLARERKQYYDVNGNVVVDFDQNPHYTRTERNAFAGCDYHEGLLFFNHYVFDTSMNELAPVPLGDPDYAQDHAYYYLMRGDYYKDGLFNCDDWRWGLWGYLDGQGAWSLPCRYVDARPFSEGLAFVEDPGTERYGFIDAQGAWAIAPRFSIVENSYIPLTSCFTGGLAYVGTLDDESNNVSDGWVDQTGAWVAKWSHWTGAINEPQAYAGSTPVWTDSLSSLSGTYILPNNDTSVQLDLAVADDGSTTAHVSFAAGDINTYEYPYSDVGETYPVEGDPIEADLTGSFVRCDTDWGEQRTSAILWGATDRDGEVVLGVAAGGDGYAQGDVEGAPALRYSLYGFRDFDLGDDSIQGHFQLGGILRAPVARTPTK